MSSWLRRHHREEDGASLVLVLVVVVVISVGLLSLASLATTNLRVTAIIRDQTTASYSADAAIDRAITAIRTNVNAGRDTAAPTSGDPCPDTVVPAGTFALGSDITVSCEAMPASGGQPTSSPPSPANVPSKAILVSSTAEPGLTVTGNPPAIDGMVVGGSVHSNSPLGSPDGSIFVGNQARLTVTAGSTITAVGTCVGANYSPGCDNGQPAVTIPAADPGWQPLPKPSREVAPGDLTGVCSTGSINLTPGTYRSGAALSRLTDTTRTDHIAACTGDVLHLAPGAYYFDFEDTNSDQRVWTLNDKDIAVVGGVLTGTPRTVGSGCDLAANGAQLVLGGPSRIQVLAGTAEVCPPLTATAQRISLYGLRNAVPDSTGSTTLTARQTRTGSAFTTPDNGRLIETTGTPAFATYATRQTVASVEVFDVDPAAVDAIPAYAVINDVQVTVKYRASNAGVQKLSLGVTPGGGTKQTTDSPNGNISSCQAATELCQNGALNTTTLTTMAFTTKASLVGAVLRFTADMTNQADATKQVELDGFSMQVNWTVRGVRAQDGCVIAATGGCNVLYVDGNQSNISMRGTTYSWGGRIVINLPNQISAFFKRGVVARKLDINLPASFIQTDPVISLPSTGLPGPPLNRVVIFTAKIGGVPYSRARVTFVDDYATASNISATVDDFSVLR